MIAKQGTATATPRLRFPEFRGMPGWSVRILGDEGELLSTLTGKTAQDFGVGSAKYVTYMNVFANTFTDMTSLGTVDVGRNESQNALAHGDVLFTVSSETPEEVGMSSVVIGDFLNCYVNSFCAMFRFSEGSQPNLHFLGYSLRQPFARRHFVKRAQGSTRFNLSKSAFRSLPLTLPLPSEQQKIADCLTSLDEVIAAQGRKVEALKAHKRGLMQQLFPREGETRPRLRFPEFRNAPKWEAKDVGDVFRVTRGEVLAMPLVTDERSSEAPYPVYSSQTKNQGLAGYYSEFLYEDAITWTTDGANAGEVNYRAGKFYCTNVCGVLLNPEGYANPCIAALLNTVTRSHVSYVGNPKLMNGVMAKITVPFPSLEEQQRIADFISSLDKQITAETNQLAALKTHKQGLMQQLFPSGSEK